MQKAIEQPLDLIKLSIDQEIHVKLKNDRELKGRLHAYDAHLNMVMGPVEELYTSVEVDEETYEKVYKQSKRNVPLIFIRGDGIVLISSQTSNQ